MPAYRLVFLLAPGLIVGCIGWEGSGGGWGNDHWRSPDGGWGEEARWRGDMGGWHGEGPAVPKPVWGAVRTLAPSPPAVSGGTLLIARNGRTAYAADPDRDVVWVADLERRALVARIALVAGDEPGRLVEDAAGRVHVVLRRGGAIAELQVGEAPTGWRVTRRAICPAPRGIAYEAKRDRLYVACAGGELVTLPAAGGPALRRVRLERDLRDVVVDGERLLVSCFRSADLLVIDADGALGDRIWLPDFHAPAVRSDALFAPALAWRAVALPRGGVAVVHQRGVLDDAKISGDEWLGGGVGCNSSIVHGAVTTVRSGASQAAGPAIPEAVLPVDIAISPSGNEFALVAAGNAHNPGMAQLFAGKLGAIGDCLERVDSIDQRPFAQPDGQATAVAFDGAGEVVVQTREPATIQRLSGSRFSLLLGDDGREDTGHSVFHSNSGGLIACASCHPEGGEDGMVWSFAGFGPRRTQSLRGGILGSEPFHWDGEMANLAMVAEQVFVHRMSGPPLSPGEFAALSRWIDALPLLSQSPPADAAAAMRGEALFRDPAGAACAGCHAGPRFTNHATLDVGTGGPFQVPSLRGVGWRTPLLHDGCAATLRARFGACGGGDRHGRVSGLSERQIADLVSYLETL